GDVVFEVFRCRDAQFPAQEARPYLGDEFAKGVGVLPLLAGPVQAARMLRPVAQFVEASAVVLVQALEGRLGWNLDVIIRRRIERLAPTVADGRTGRLDGILGWLVIDSEGLIGVNLTHQ